jgi:outer membrane receptor protein involved in Fe transport
LSTALFAPVLLAVCSQLLAEETVLEVVTVTAQKRAQSLQDVPISVSAVAGEKLENSDITDLADLTAYVPNFSKADASIGNFLVIRGISSGLNQGFEQSVVQFVDDVALSRANLARMPFLDLERVEVLRGPQNVLFGKNAIGGAISMTTAKPTHEVMGRVLLEYTPEWNGRRATVVASGPFSDTVRGRIAARYSRDDGYFDNNLNGRDEPGHKETAIRGILDWDVTDTFDASLKLEHSRFDFSGRNDEIVFTYTNPAPGNAFFGLTYPQIAGIVGQLTGQAIGSDDGVQDYHRNTNIDESSDNEVNNATLRLNWDLDWATLTSVTGYVEYEVDEWTDADGAGIDAFTIAKLETFDQLSQEIRFTSPGGEFFDWIAGGYYQTWDLNHRSDFQVDDESLWSALGILGQATGDPGLGALGVLSNLQNTRLYDADSDVWAVFGQGTFSITDRFRLTAGARYTKEKKSAHRIMDVINTQTGQFDLVQAATASAVFGVDFKTLGEVTGGLFPIHDIRGSRSESSFTPSLILEFDATDDTMLYASAKKGFKAGGFDGAGNRAGDFEFEDENVRSFEGGMKTAFAGGAAELNAALFYTDYRNLQVSQFDGTLGFFVGNAAQATSKGIELDGRWAISDKWMLMGSVGYLDFTFDEFENATCPAMQALITGQKVCDFSGKSNIFTPKWSAAFSLDYLTPISGSLDFHGVLDVNFVDKQFVDVTLNPDVQQDAFTKLNARISLEGEWWSVALVGTNLTDEDISTYLTDTPLSNTLGAPSYTGYMDRPRTVTLQVRFNY